MNKKLKGHTDCWKTLDDQREHINLLTEEVAMWKQNIEDAQKEWDALTKRLLVENENLRVKIWDLKVIAVALFATAAVATTLVVAFVMDLLRYAV